MSKLTVKFIFLLFLKYLLTSSWEVASNSIVHEASNEPAEFYITGGFRPHDTVSVSRFVVSLRGGKMNTSFGDNHQCGGSIIAPSLILTAAHCLVDRQNKKRSPDTIMIVAGTPDRCIRIASTQEIGVRETVIHEKFIRGVEHYDIGLIKLKAAFQIDDKTVSLIRPAIKAPAPGTHCSILGWGRLFMYGPRPDKIVHSNLSVVPYAICFKAYAYVEIGLLCAGDRPFETDVCKGDSGGPLICNGEVAGIVSRNKGCAVGFPAVYTDVAYFGDWLRKACAAHYWLDVRMLAFLLVVHLYCLFK